MDTFGRPIKSHEETTMEFVTQMADVREKVREYIVTPACGRNHAANKRIIVIGASSYCEDSANGPIGLLPAEMAIGVFSLADGVEIVNEKHMLVNPGEFVGDGRQKKSLPPS
jgi:hypothetical protein